MFWKQKVYRNNDIRIRKGFLWFPKTCRNITRWLEYAEWKEQLFIYTSDYEWEVIAWIDKKKLVKNTFDTMFRKGK